MPNMPTKRAPIDRPDFGTVNASEIDEMVALGRLFIGR
jgi:hypothetical protein